MKIDLEGGGEGATLKRMAGTAKGKVGSYRKLMLRNIISYQESK